MSGTGTVALNYLLRRAIAAMLGAMGALLACSFPASASAEERTLYLFYTHTSETARITFWRNGHFDQRGLAQLNQFLRDWRRGEVANMDPDLFNLVWQVYEEVGATQPIHIVSAFRAPETNEILRSRSSAVAKNSRHTQGMAMDFYIPGIPISTLRAVAMKYQVGGVGYYPSSGSPFVHLDTGSVRAWPRMTRAQLQQIFPDGRTLHLPTDGVPLSQEGRQYAAAQWQRCHQVPCSSRSTSGETIQLASTGERRSLLDIFRGDEEEAGDIEVASAPTSRNVTSQPVLVAPVPPARPEPAIELASADVAPVPPVKPAAIELATLTAQFLAPPAPTATLEADRIAVALLETPLPDSPARGLRATIPADGGELNRLFAAYAPVSSGPASAQRAVEMLIEQRLAETFSADRQQMLVAAYEAAADPSPGARRALDMLLNQQKSEIAIGNGALNVEAAPIVTASFSPQPDIGALIFGRGADPVQQPLPALVSRPVPMARQLETRHPDLVAPDFEHGIDFLIDPAPLNSSHFAELFLPDRADFDPATELGVATGTVRFSYESSGFRASYSFAPPSPLLLASR